MNSHNNPKDETRIWTIEINDPNILDVIEEWAWAHEAIGFSENPEKTRIDIHFIVETEPNPQLLKDILGSKLNHLSTSISRIFNLDG